MYSGARLSVVGLAASFGTGLHDTARELAAGTAAYGVYEGKQSRLRVRSLPLLGDLTVKGSTRAQEHKSNTQSAM